MKFAGKLLVTLGAAITAHAAAGQQIDEESFRTSSVMAAREQASQDGQAEADAIVEAAWPAEGPGLAVLVTRNGEILYSNTRGMADIERGEPVTLDTVFRIGSMTKQFTAALVLTLAEEGKLSLDDPLAKFVRGYPAPGGQATVRQLLNHTSGIQSYNEIPGWFAEPNTSRAFTTAELIAVFRDLPARFEPGDDWAYNNSGYVLLAAIIEAVTGEPWHVALRERITGPLGLSSVRHGLEEGKIAERAVPYSAAPDGVGPAPRIHPTIFSAAGALMGSVHDLARWSAALHHGKVVNADSYVQMITPAPLPAGPPIPYGFGFFREKVAAGGSRTAPYGYGFFREKIRGIEAISHGGSAPGGATMGVYLPEQDIFVAAFSNNDAPTTHPATIARRLAALAAGRPYPLLGRVAADPESLEPLFGTYAMADGAEQQLYVGGGQVRLLADDREWPVYFAGEDRFMFDPDYLDWFEITRRPSGDHVIEIHDAATGEVHRGVRTGPLPPRVVPRATLERYVGRYELNGTVATIALDSGDTLTIQLAGQPTAGRLRTVSATQFAADAVGALLTFEGEGPKASRLKSRLGEVEIVGSRLPDAAEPSAASAQDDSTTASTAQAAAGEGDSSGGDSIVVTGRMEPPSRSEVYEQARELSRVGRYQLYDEPLPRFEMPLCPGVSGLKTDAAEMMVARIRANAARVDVKLAKPNCSPNLVVAFVDDGQTMLSKIAETHRERFCTLPASEQAEILAEGAPVRVWNQIIVIGPTAHVRRCRWHVPSKSGGPGQMFLPSRRDIVSSLVVFERDAVAGMTLVQLADYATMRGLSHTRPAVGEEAMPTILALFTEGSPRPEELTSFDVGYLRSLYWSVPNVSAASKLLALRGRALQEQRPTAALQK